jgi:glyoxylase-like metal-dependent hydrolase (beta-lactamase superfamily II)
MYKKIAVLIITILICIHSFSGCSSKQINQNKIESQKIDSLIKMHKVNDRTVMVNFGYDAVTAIKTTHGIVLVDAGISTLLTDKFRKTFEDVFRQNNYLYVINTHGHHDHIAGNGIFSQAKVVGHENCQDDISERWTNPDKSMMNLSRIIEDYDQHLRQSMPNTAEWNDIFTQKIRYMSALWDVKNHVSVRLPDITFSDSLKIELGDTTFELIYFGRFHSNSDILIYVPEIRTLFIGDLFSKYGRPSMNNSLITDEIRWMQAIKWIKKRTNNYDTIIDGHGQILTIDDVQLFTNNLLKKYSHGENN